MPSTDCRYFDRCNAPLCPLDEQSLRFGVWFSDEEICRARSLVKGLKWVANQRKVAKKAKRTDRYFTVQMLDRDFIIRTGIEGLDPDSETPEQDLKKWLKAHPEKTQKQIERYKQSARDRLNKPFPGA